MCIGSADEASSTSLLNGGGMIPAINGSELLNTLSQSEEENVTY